ncbi:protein NTM1-like 9 [Hevea brasiliensis]|uniref:protein NTM1-like 9 n=1 Tax=Hevea brasiliensis TaxID=3981 RepID=UPI0025D0927A|nr:protein NTM1-like 9 [Hevea brasiliensis]XP_058008506.1 protein NTM1-like 9 [Hevea brasiliensis]
MDSGIGYRFHPTDEELVNHYLRLKMLGYDHEVQEIPDVNVLDFEPWDLPHIEHPEVVISYNPNDQVWYFFCPRKYRNSNSHKAKRTTNAGYWKVTSKDRKINENCIKKNLVFYQGRHKGEKTNWIMHEYNPTFNFPTQRDFVLCKLKKKPDDSDDMPTLAEGDQSSTVVASASASGNNITEEDSQLQAYMESFNGIDETDFNLNYALQWPTYNYN